MVALLLLREPDHGPGQLTASATDRLNAVVAVLKGELAVAVSDDYWRGVPTLFGQLVQSIDPVIPIVLVHWAEDWVAGRPGEAMKLIDRQLDWTGPPAEFSTELLGQDGVIASRAGQESSHPGCQLVLLGGRSSAMNRVLRGIVHLLLLPIPPRDVTSLRRSALRVETQQVSVFVKRMQRPPIQGRFVLPLGHSSVRRSHLGPRPRVWDVEQHADRRHDDTRVADGHHSLIDEIRGHSLAHLADPFVEGEPTLATGSEQALGLRLHVERSVSSAILCPSEAISLSGMDLAEITLLTVGLKAQRWGDDCRGLDRPR
jgi:hypothetical protein